MPRNKMQLDMAILQALQQKPLIFTRLMYATHINGGLMKQRTASLERRGLITVTEKSKPVSRVLSSNPKRFSRRIYAITRAGSETVRAYDAFLTRYNNELIVLEAV